jgi:hypothetical protein
MRRVTGALCHVSLVLWHSVTWLVRRVMGQSHNERLANFTVLMTVATFVVAGAAVVQLSELRNQEHKQLRAYLGVKPAAGQINLASGVILNRT